MKNKQKNKKTTNMQTNSPLKLDIPKHTCIFHYHKQLMYLPLNKTNRSFMSPLLIIRDKTHHNHEMLKVANSPNTIQPNYYLSIASVDSNSIESTCIFPETLNKTHKRMCGK